MQISRNLHVGLKIQGASSRNYAFKRFNVYSRKIYNGERMFGEEIFDKRYTHSFILRNVFGDAIAQALCHGRNVETQETLETVLFLNGEYWYDTFITEKYSGSYFEDKYGIDKDNIVIAKNMLDKDESRQDQGLVDEIYDYLERHSFTTEQEYAEFNEIVDMQSYIDYMCMNIYLCNMDMNEDKNHLMWRARERVDDEYGDGRWRWMMYDMDAIEWNNPMNYEVEDTSQINSFRQKPYTADRAVYELRIWRNVKNIPSFCEQFVVTFMDLVNTNFSIANIEEKLAMYGETLKWNGSFFLEREQYIVPYMAEEFGLQGSLETVELKINDINGGKIILNTIKPDMSEGSWKGQYYTDYPVCVTAVAKPGYEFVGWKGSIESAAETVEVLVQEGGTLIQAEFRKMKE